MLQNTDDQGVGGLMEGPGGGWEALGDEELEVPRLHQWAGEDEAGRGRLYCGGAGLVVTFDDL